MFWEHGSRWGCDGRPASDLSPGPAVEIWAHATEGSEAAGQLGTAQVNS